MTLDKGDLIVIHRFGVVRLYVGDNNYYRYDLINNIGWSRTLVSNEELTEFFDETLTSNLLVKVK